MPDAIHAGLRRPIFFLHMPKTGGVSLQSVLASRCAAERSLLAVESHILMPDTGGSLAGFDLVTGHLPWALRHLFKGPFVAMSVFRDPWERALSAYRHLQRDLAHSDHALLRREAPSLAAAVNHPRLRWHFLSPYTRLLGADDGPVLEALGKEPRDVHLAVRTLRVAAVPDEAMLARALAAVEALDFVGLTEAIDRQAPAFLAGLLGEAPDLPRLNQSLPEQMERFSAEELAVLEEPLRHDLEVWQAVRRRVARGG